jgi:hypothetical protein
MVFPENKLTQKIMPEGGCVGVRVLVGVGVRVSAGVVVDEGVGVKVFVGVGVCEGVGVSVGNKKIGSPGNGRDSSGTANESPT